MSILREIYETLVETFGDARPDDWWPEDPLEVIVGAILVPGSNWKTVAGILENLKSSGLMDFRSLEALEPDALTELIRSAGFQQRKSAAIRGVLELIDATAQGDLPRFFARDTDMVRMELLAIKGVGVSVADNILLYAGNLPVYMVDPFTVRILTRHGIVGSKAKASEVQDLIHRELTHDGEPHGAALYHAFQALIVRTGREYCAKTNPNCRNCPLSRFLPENGPICDQETRPRTFKSSHFLQSPRVPQSGSQAKIPPLPETVPLDDNERKLLGLITLERLSIDILVEAAQLPVHVVQATLIGLEFKRLVRRCEGNTVQRR